MVRKAGGEAIANRLRQSTLTENVLKQKWIEKWNGQLSTYSGINGSNMLVNPK